jgi:hypothetical protein
VKETTGQDARPMTKRDLVGKKKKRDKAFNIAVHVAANMIKFNEANKEGDKTVTKTEIEEFYASMT